MIYLGIDPGKQGGASALIDYDGLPDSCVHKLSFSTATERDIAQWIYGMKLGEDERTIVAVIEKVHSSPQMGVTSAFTFGRGYGFLRGVLSASGIPFVEVTPQKWQKAMECMSGGDKNVTKARAQQLYPGEKVTHATADALLLATYCRRHHKDLF
jgi:crossover junction endodeoxyribonuclease RuvC